jgi:DNA-binding NtrC family response regulator
LHAGATNVYDDVVRTMELQLLQRVLNFTGGNQSRAALILGITRGSLRTKIERVGLRRNGIAQLPADRKKPRPSGRSAAMMSK